MNRHSASNQVLLPGFLAGFVCSLFLIPHPLAAASPGSNDPQEHDPLEESVTSSIKAISREKSSAVVRIRCNDGHGEIVGTGFYIDPTGTICTLAEIVQGAHDITVEQDGKVLPATVAALDLRSGVAFLKITAESDTDNFLPPLSITNAPELTPVISIGYPLEQEATPVLGLITGRKNHEGNCYLCVTHLMASLPLAEGEGGSPVLSLSGKLLGIVVCGNTQLGLCTILPSAAIEKLHHNLLLYGSLNPGWVGAVVEITTAPQRNSLTRIASVTPGSPAEAAGLRRGDVLLSLGNHSIHVPEDVLEASFYLTAGEPLQVKILRAGVAQTLTLQCGEQPSSETEITTTNIIGSTAALGVLQP